MNAQDHGSETTGRVYAQLLAFTDCPDIKVLFRPLEYAELECVLYKDVNDPLGIALLTISEDPELFAGGLRDMLSARPFRMLLQKRDLSMFGHTGAGDADGGPILRAMPADRERPWAMWYALRHPPEFSGLDAGERQRLLGERQAAVAALDGDVRGVLLSCHGMLGDGADLVQGLAGKRLAELSAAVERLAHAGHPASIEARPFFVGRAVWQGEETPTAKARW